MAIIHMEAMRCMFYFAGVIMELQRYVAGCSDLAVAGKLDKSSVR
jgi:hypothetical protein